MVAMDWIAIKAWLYTGSWLGIHRVAWAGLGAMTLLELVLGKVKNPQLRSLASAIALAIQKTLEVTKMASIPVVGPLVVNALKVVDGDPTPMMSMSGRKVVEPTPRNVPLDAPPPAPTSTEPPKAA